MGKTKLSLSLAKALNGSIISADSMQVYKHMDIGSAKICPEEMEGVPHYLIDVLEPEADFNVVLFQQMAKSAMKEIYGAGRIPIVTGGTGFYIQALLKEVDFSESGGVSPFRERLEAEAAEKGPEYLHGLLAERDPQAGRQISGHNEIQREKESPYCYAYFVLNDDRDRLYRQIDRRVDQMMKAGLLEEVRSLYDRGLTEENVSMKGLGYKELFLFLRGEITLEEAVRVIKRDTRHFAKRQLTWFRREKEVIWLNKPEFSYDEQAILDYMLDLWQKKLREEEQRK